MKKIIAICLGFFLVSCATKPSANKVQLKMTKEVVLKKMGEPNITSGEGEIEYFTYYLYPSKEHKLRSELMTYEVKFRNGKVVKYGPQGEKKDYSSPVTKRPTVKVAPVTLPVEEVVDPAAGQETFGQDR